MTSVWTINIKFICASLPACNYLSKGSEFKWNSLRSKKWHNGRAWLASPRPKTCMGWRSIFPWPRPTRRGAQAHLIFNLFARWLGFCCCFIDLPGWMSPFSSCAEVGAPRKHAGSMGRTQHKDPPFTILQLDLMWSEGRSQVGCFPPEGVQAPYDR